MTEEEKEQEKHDIEIIDDGSIMLFLPLTDVAKEWIKDNVNPESQWFGRGLAVERRHAHDLIRGMQEAGLTVEE